MFRQHKYTKQLFTSGNYLIYTYMKKTQFWQFSVCFSDIIIGMYANPEFRCRRITISYCWRYRNELRVRSVQRLNSTRFQQLNHLRVLNGKITQSRDVLRSKSELWKITHGQIWKYFQGYIVVIFRGVLKAKITICSTYGLPSFQIWRVRTLGSIEIPPE